jgi:hypothetical protein
VRAGLLTFLVAALSLVGQSAAASCPTPSNGKPALCRNDFKLELHQGPIFAPLRVTAMGGAYAAIAEGVEGLGQNAASAAVRPPYSTGDFEYDLSASWYLPGAFGDTDFDNRGEAGLNSTSFFYTFGALAQYRGWAIGASADFQRYTLSSSDPTVPSASISVGRGHASIARTFLDDQLSLGGGVRVALASVNTLSPGASSRDIFQRTQDNVLSMSGLSPEIGALYKPDFAPWRLGVTYRFPVSAAAPSDSVVSVDDLGVRRAAGLALPEQVYLPWELEIGVALNAGPRPLNPRRIEPRAHERLVDEEILAQREARRRVQQRELSGIEDPVRRRRREEEFARAEPYVVAEEDARRELLHDQLEDERRARYKNWPRARILVVAEALITGSTTRGVGVQSFLRQEDVTSGARVTVQPRLGLEGEPVIDWVIARIGTYVEPSRYSATPLVGGVLAGARQHFTFGLEVRTFTWDLLGAMRPTPFTIQLGGDLAPRYQNFGLSVGLWH